MKAFYFDGAEYHELSNSVTLDETASVQDYPWCDTGLTFEMTSSFTVSWTSEDRRRILRLFGLTNNWRKYHGYNTLRRVPKRYIVGKEE